MACGVWNSIFVRVFVLGSHDVFPSLMQNVHSHLKYISVFFRECLLQIIHASFTPMLETQNARKCETWHCSGWGKGGVEKGTEEILVFIFYCLLSFCATAYVLMLKCAVCFFSINIHVLHS